MKKILLLLAAGPLAAEDGARLGLRLAHATDTYRFATSRSQLLPFFQYESQHFYVDGLGAGLRLAGGIDEEASLGLGLRYQPEPAWRPPRASGLERRAPAFQLELNGHWDSPLGRSVLRFGRDLARSGHTLELQQGYYFPLTPRLALKPALGLVWGDGRHRRYYYGVSAGEAARSGLVEYRPGAGWTPYAEISAFYQLSPRLNLSAGLRRSYLTGDAAHSPVSRRRSGTSATLGLHYQW